MWGHHFPKTNVIVHRAPKGSVVFTLKFWSKRRQFCVLGSVYTQGPEDWRAGQPLQRRQPLLMEKGPGVQWVLEGKEDGAA